MTTLTTTTPMMTHFKSFYIPECLCFQPAKTFFRSFSISSYVGFVPVSNFSAIFVSVWRNEFSPLFSFMTDTTPNFGWRVFVGPRSTKTSYVLVNPKVSDENFRFIAFITIPLVSSIFQVVLFILTKIFKVTLM